MELNEVSAQRVNDVYSELAAITASNTQEIADAMTRTASIANSAGMAFETTAAMLAQAIETTREAPENLGTAMKTIVARFQELKKLPSEIEPVDGEMVDANKIDTALKSIGVSLRDTTGQFRNLDEVFLEISSKWGGLDRNTQRYIATIAAGSRQQSRFIALMSNYERTLQLVNSANNSAGASQRQFEKTVDSLESKLNKLKNAWDEFSMGIANSAIIKLAVDTLTGLITAVNKVSGAFGNGVGSIIKFVGAISGFIGAQKLVYKGLGAIGNAIRGVDPGPSTVKNITNLSTKLASFGSEMFKTFSLMRNVSKVEFSAKIFEELFSISKQGSLKGFFNNTIDSTIIKELAQTYNLTTDEVIAYSAAVNAGCSQTQAMEILSKKATMAQIQEAYSQHELTEEKMKAIVAEAGLADAKKLSTAQSVATNLSLMFGTKAQRAMAAETLNAAGATNIFNKAMMKLNATKLGGLIGSGGILVGLLAISAAAYGIYKLVEHNSIEKRIERATAATKEAEKAASEAQQKYQEILSTIDEYKQIEDNFDNLAEGTLAWRDSLLEANNVVLQLLRTFPELAQYISNINGRMVISDEGLGYIKDAASQRMENAISRQYSAQIKQSSLEREKLYGRLGRNLVIESDSWVDEGGNAHSTQKDYSQYTKELVDFYSQNIGDIEKAKLSGDWEVLAERITTIPQEDKANLKQDLSQIIKEVEKYYSDISQLEASNAKIYSNLFQNNGVDDNVAERFGLYFASSDLFDHEKLLKQEKAKIGNAKKEYENIFGAIPDAIADDEEAIRTAVAEFKVSEVIGNKQKEIYDELKNNEKYNKLLIGDYEIVSSKPLDYSGLSDQAKEFAETSYKILEDELKKAKDGLAGIDDNFGLNNNEIVELYNSFKAITDKLGEGNKQFVVEFLSESGEKNLDRNIQLLQDLDMSSAVTGFSKLSKLLDHTDDQVKQLGFDLLTNNRQFFSTSNQLKEVFTGIDTDTMEDLMEDSQITSSEIMELAKSNKTLETYMKNTGAGAAELGSIFTKLQTGVISLTDVTNGYIASMRELYSLENKISDSFAFIENFEEVQSQTEISDFYSEAQEKLLELYKIGAYGDQQLHQYAALMFGDNWDKALEDAGNNYKSALDKLVKDIAAGSNPLYTAWKNLASSNLEGIGLLGDGSIQIDLSLYSSLDELIEKIQEKTGYTKEYVEAMVSDFSTYSADFKAQVESLQKINALNTLVRESAYFGENKISVGLTDAQLADFGDPEKLREDIRKQLKEVYSVAVEVSPEVIIGKINLDDFNAKFSNIISRDIGDGASYERSSSENEEQEVVYKYSFEGDDNLSEELMTKYAADDAIGMMVEMGADFETARTQLLDWLDEERFEININGKKLTKDTAKGIVEGLTAKEVYQAQLAEAKALGVANYKEMTIKIVAAFSTGIDLARNIASSFGDGFVTKLINGALDKAENAVDSAGQRVWTALEENAKKYETDFNLDFNGLMDVGDSTSYSTLSSRLGDRNSKSNSSKSKKTKEVEGLDRLYNLLQRISAEQRLLNRYQTQYNLLVENAGGTVAETLENLKKQRDIMNQTAAANNNLIAGRRSQISSLLGSKMTYTVEDSNGNEKTKTSKYKLSSYASYNQDLGAIQISWDKVDKLRTTNPELYQVVKDNISKLEGWAGEVEDANDELISYQEQMIELYKRSRESYIDLEDRIYEAIVAAEQRRIDELARLDDSITTANSKLLDGMQKAIDKARQDRENEKTEEEISDKERRLAYLRRDTSNANLLEIRQLEKEIQEQKEDYTDTLIDQKLTALQDQNDLAAEQRQAQIDMLQSMLDYNQENGVYWDKVHSLMKTGIDSLNGLVTGSELANLLQANEGWDGLSNTARVAWLEETNQLIKEAKAYEEKIFENTFADSALNSAGVKSGDPITFTQGDGRKITGTLQGNKVFYDGAVGDSTYFEYDFSRMTQNKDGSWSTSETTSQARRFVTDKEINIRAKKNNEDKIVIVKAKANEYGYLESAAKDTDINGTRYDDLEVTTTGLYYTKKARKIEEKNPNSKVVFRYATGGLADYTGPAWLDGTKSRPELVLNQKDTQNFIALKDILRNVMSRNNSNTAQNGGVMNVEVHIDVEKLENDYDVEQVADKVKRMLTAEARNRNVNNINILR